MISLLTSKIPAFSHGFWTFSNLGAPGLLGYNAVLVGAGFAVFVQNFLLAAVATLVFGTLSALLAAGLSALDDGVIGQPSSTILWGLLMPGWWFMENKTCLKPPSLSNKDRQRWWFQTCFIFHNIWDNPSH